MKIRIKLIHPDASPYYATDGAAAADIFACVSAPVVIPAGGRALIPSGVAVELPPRHCALVFARSGLSAKHGICLANGVGLIDSDYRGEIMVSIQNLSGDDFTVNPGDRIAQMMVMSVPRAEFEVLDELSGSGRGAGGFGSTGL